MKTFKEKINSDEAAMNTTEVLLLIVGAVFAFLALYNYVLVPFSDSAEGMGEVIKTMDPQ